MCAPRFIPLVALAGCLLAETLPAQTQAIDITPKGPIVPSDAKLEEAHIITSSKRILVSGLSSAANMDLAMWAESALGRMELLTGRFPVVHPHMPIAILARAGEDLAPKVVRYQSFNSGFFTQKLVIVQPDEVDQEDVLEGLAWLMLNRMIFELQPDVARRQDPVEAPDWIAVGLAQNIYTELKNRNHKNVVRDMARKELMSAEQVMNQVYLPYGRWREKTYCGLYSEWLIDETDTTALYRSLCRTIAVKQPVNLDLIARAKKISDPQNAWASWMIDRAKNRLIVGPLTTDDLARFKAMLAIGPERWKEAVGNQPYTGVNLVRLIHLRDEPWAPALIQRLEKDIMLFMVGRPQAFQTVAKEYLTFFEALSKARGKKKFKKVLTQLKQADQALAQFEETHLKRSQYIDDVARSWEEVQDTQTIRPRLKSPLQRVEFQVELHTYMNAMELLMQDIEILTDAAETNP